MIFMELKKLFQDSIIQNFIIIIIDLNSEN